MKSILTIVLILILSSGLIQCTSNKDESNFKEIPVEAYQKAVYASWIGQIIGNTYGLGYEFKFIDEPGTNKLPYCYGFTIADLRK